MKSLSKILIVTLALCLAVSSLPAQAAFATDEAVTADTPMPDVLGLQAKVDEASAVYDEATQRISEMQAEIDALNDRISEIQRELPAARTLSNDAASEYYRMMSTSNMFLEIIFGATSLADFLAKVDYSVRINQGYLDDIFSLSRLNAELEEDRVELEAKKEALEAEQLHAEEALLDAQYAHDVAEEAAFKIAEATAAATAEIAAAAEAEAHAPEAPIEPSNPETTAPPETISDKQSFVNLWAPRIDAYLAGSPMAGCGFFFANAAYDYNVDPRWSPAIACLESSKGLYCFLPYNAWGWGSVSWPNWETAIYSHVRGLSIGYGYTISEASAQKYCPPNWEYWYSFVSAQMNLI